MAKRKHSIGPDHVFIGKKTARRVIYTFEHDKLGTRIVYSIGGDGLNRECGYVTFRRWIRKDGARRSTAARTPVLHLRASP